MFDYFLHVKLNVLQLHNPSSNRKSDMPTIALGVTFNPNILCDCIALINEWIWSKPILTPSIERFSFLYAPFHQVSLASRNTVIELVECVQNKIWFITTPLYLIMSTLNHTTVSRTFSGQVPTTL